MGQSTDAYLFYGYTWHEEETPFGDRDTYDLSEESKELFGVEVNSHCSCDYPIPYIYISESHTVAWRGQPKSISASDVISDTGEWNERLAKFIEHYDVSLLEPDEYSKAPDGPGWFLVSNWC